MSLYQKLKTMRENFRGNPEHTVALGILTLMAGDLENESINGKEYKKELVLLSADMDRPEDKDAIEVMDGIEYLVNFVLVRDDSEITDAKVEAKARQFIGSNMKTIGYGTKDSDKLKAENETLLEFLPKMMEDEVLRQHIVDSGATNIGGVMGHLKQYKGFFDGSKAKKFADEYLASK